jgi:hypothetical protein
MLTLETDNPQKIDQSCFQPLSHLSLNLLIALIDGLLRLCWRINVRKQTVKVEAWFLSRPEWPAL